MASEDLLADHKIRKVTLDPAYAYAEAETRGGENQIVQLAPTMWVASIVTAPLTEANYAQWLGWLDAQRNGFGKFKLYALGRDYPRAYLPSPPALTRAAGGAFDWTCTLASVNALDRFNLNLSGLPNGFVLSPGDYIGFDYSSGTKRSFHRVKYPGAIANGSGLMSVYVEPAAMPDVSGTPTVQLYRPHVVMQIKPNSINYGARDVTGTTRVIEFQARQVFKN